MPRSSSGTATARPPLMAASGRPAAGEQNQVQAGQLQHDTWEQRRQLIAGSFVCRRHVCRWPSPRTHKHRLIGGSRRELARVDALCRAVGQPTKKEDEGQTAGISASLRYSLSRNAAALRRKPSPGLPQLDHLT